MGQKVNPHGLRVGVIKDWDAKWYAEDGIRDVLGSRGLGDVYKRQHAQLVAENIAQQLENRISFRRAMTVSYTHLTLPTKA